MIFRYFKKLFFLLLFLSFFVLVLPAQNNFVIGVVPSQNSSIMVRWFNPLLQHLEKTLGRNVSLYIARDYDDLTDKIQLGQVSMGYYGAASYVAARTRLPGLQYVCTFLRQTPDGDLTDFYRGYILTRKDSGILSLDDLRGKKFGFTDFNSSSGYRYPRYLLIQKGYQPESFFGQVFMLKKHDRVVNAILAGSIDAGATYSTQYQLSRQQHGDVFRILAETDPIPNEVFVVASGIPTQDVVLIRNELLTITQQFSSTEEGTLSQMRSNGYPFFGWSRRTPDFYNVVESVSNFETGRR